jgi:hypothetical protein
MRESELKIQPFQPFARAKAKERPGRVTFQAEATALPGIQLSGRRFLVVVV